jgi:hypothetical protein
MTDRSHPRCTQEPSPSIGRTLSTRKDIKHEKTRLLQKAEQRCKGILNPPGASKEGFLDADLVTYFVFVKRLSACFIASNSKF